MGHTASNCSTIGRAPATQGKTANPNSDNSSRGNTEDSNSGGSGSSNRSRLSDGDGVTIDVLGPGGSNQRVSCNYLILADGANSSLRFANALLSYPRERSLRASL